MSRAVPLYSPRVICGIAATPEYADPRSERRVSGRAPNPLSGIILRHMKVEEIAEAVAKLPPDQLTRFRRWFTAF